MTNDTDTEAAFDQVTAQQLRALGWEKWSHYPPDVLPAHVAEMDFGTAPAVTQALHQGAAGAGLGYLSRTRAEVLSQACAEYQATQFGWQVDPAAVRPVTDVMRSLHLAIEYFTEPGSPVVVPTPTYFGLVATPPEMGRRRIDVPLVPGPDGPTFDEAGLLDAVHQGAGMILLCSPHNPIGRVWRQADLAILERVVERTGALVFADEIHSPLVFPGQGVRHQPFAALSEVAAAHTITAVSAAKGWNIPGLKCAQVIFTNPDHLARWRALNLEEHSAPSTMGALANVAAYREGQPWLDRVLAYLQANRDWLAAQLATRAGRIGHRPPEATYLAWLDVRGLGLGPDLAPDADPLWRQPGRYFLTQAKVALTDGAAWGTGGAGHVRLNFATPRPVLKQIVDRLVAALPSQ
ncbi:MAG: aminotransferase class I/II-fold pyridoxal phosphate-dependent enzyme [Bifidobacteriaceae bacterium]|nr:aminotransferase class I/II-fold pyridoxal phosphate-dependent enzyme [Bifidobacteriaceae bacterium]